MYVTQTVLDYCARQTDVPLNHQQNRFNSVHTRLPQLDKVTSDWMKMIRFFMQKVLSSSHGTLLGILFAFLKTHTHTEMFVPLKVKKTCSYFFFFFFFYLEYHPVGLLLIFSSGYIANTYNEINEIHVALGCFFLIATLTFLNNNQ